MKENGIIKTKWRRGDNNPADMFTKNLAGPAFVKESTGNDQGKDDEIKTYLQTKLKNNNNMTLCGQGHTRDEKLKIKYDKTKIQEKNENHKNNLRDKNKNSEQIIVKPVNILKESKEGQKDTKYKNHVELQIGEQTNTGDKENVNLNLNLNYTPRQKVRITGSNLKQERKLSNNETEKKNFEGRKESNK